MTNLLEMREYLKSYYARYEEFIVPISKFLLGFILFLMINTRLGYMNRLDNLAIVLVAALFSSFMPLGMMVFLCAVFIGLHVYALSLECLVVLAAVYVVIGVLYFRFAPKSHLLLLLTPLLFVWHIPYVMPIVAGLFCGPGAAAPVVCGVILYYVLSFMSGNASSLGSAGADSAVQRMQDLTTGVLKNRGMMIMVIAFGATVLLVYAIRRMSIDYSRAIAVLVGTLADIVILLVGDLMYDANFSILAVIFGSILGAVLAIGLQFFKFNLDYARVEKVQFEDDEYYYYVKAVPKMSVAAPEKRVKRITAQRRSQNVRHSQHNGRVRK